MSNLVGEGSKCLSHAPVRSSVDSGCSESDLGSGLRSERGPNS